MGITESVVELPGIARQLLQEGLVSEADCLHLVDDARDQQCSFVRSLIRSGLVAESELLSRLSQIFRIPALDLSQVNLVRIPTGWMPFSVMLQHEVLPLQRLRDGAGVFACTDPSDPAVARTIQMICSVTPDFVLVEPSKLSHFFQALQSNQPLQSVLGEDPGQASGSGLRFWKPADLSGSRVNSADREPSLDDFLRDGSSW